MSQPEHGRQRWAVTVSLTGNPLAPASGLKCHAAPKQAENTPRKMHITMSIHLPTETDCCAAPSSANEHVPAVATLRHRGKEQ